MMETAFEGLKSDSLNIEKLESIAGTRFAFSVLASWFHLTFENPKEQAGLHPIEIRPTLKAAENLCEKSDFKWPRLVTSIRVLSSFTEGLRNRLQDIYYSIPTN